MNLEKELTAFDSGDLSTAYNILGAHRQGDYWCFRVWAPNAKAIHVVGDFNFWNTTDLPMQPIGHGVWEAVSEFAKVGQAYKYCITQVSGRQVMKADPYGYQMTPLPDTSSVLCDLSTYRWGDGVYRRTAARRKMLNRPVNIYEVHLGSWKCHEDGSFL